MGFRPIRFIRFKMATYIAARGLAGWLIFNGLGWGALAVFFSVFCSNVAIYGYNLITDIREDRANNRALPERGGWLVVGTAVALGLAASATLGGAAPWFWSVLLVIGLLYSRLRVKDIFPLKNIYIAFGGAWFFLFGASPHLQFTPEMVAGYLIFAAVAVIVSLVADLRDIAGDAVNGVKSLPVVLGREVSEMIAYGVIAAVSIMVAAMQLAVFYPIAVMAVPASYHLGRRAYVKSQSFMIIAAALVPGILMVLELV